MSNKKNFIINLFINFLKIFQDPQLFFGVKRDQQKLI